MPHASVCIVLHDDRDSLSPRSSGVATVKVSRSGSASYLTMLDGVRKHAAQTVQPSTDYISWNTQKFDINFQNIKVSLGTLDP